MTSWTTLLILSGGLTVAVGVMWLWLRVEARRFRRAVDRVDASLDRLDGSSSMAGLDSSLDRLAGSVRVLQAQLEDER